MSWFLFLLSLMQTPVEEPVAKSPVTISFQVALFEAGFKNHEEVMVVNPLLRVKLGQQVMVIVSAIGPPGTKISMPITCLTEHDHPMNNGTYTVPTADPRDRFIDGNGLMLYYRVMTPGARSHCRLSVFSETEAFSRWEFETKGYLYH